MTTRSTPIHIDDAHPAPLSAAGRARRDAMLADLQSAVVGAARRRRVLRAAAIVGPPAVALAVAVALLTPPSAPPRIAGVTRPTSPAPSPTPLPAVPPDAGRDEPAAYTMRHANFQLIDTPPSARIITDPPSHVRTISDDELLHILRAAGHDVGLIRAGRRVILTDNRPDDEADGPSSRLDPAPPRPAADPAV